MPYANLTIKQGHPLIALDAALVLQCRVEFRALKVGDQPLTDIAQLNAAGGTNTLVTLTAKLSDIAEWQPDNNPNLDQGIFLAAFGNGIMQFYPALAIGNPNRFDISIHGTAKVIGMGPTRELLLESGSVRLWTRDGLSAPNGIFRYNVGGGPQTYEEWRESIWPENGWDLAAIVFGAERTAVEVYRRSINPSVPAVRRRLELVREGTTQRVWQLQACFPSRPLLNPNEIEAPEEVLAERRRMVEEPMQARAFVEQFAIRDRPSLESTEGEVLYVTTRRLTNGRTIEYSRPMFDVIVRDRARDRSAVWSPRTLQVNGQSVTLHDADFLELLRAGTAFPPDPPNAVLLGWKAASVVAPAILDQVAPAIELTCLGSNPPLLSGEYLLQYGLVTPAPTRAGVDLPGWIRYQLPEGGSPLPEPLASSTLSNALPISAALFIDGWSLELLPNDSPASKSLELTVGKTGNETQLQLKAFQPAVTVYSPALQAFNSQLSAPWDAPAVKTLVRANGSSLLSPTSLVFAAASADDRTSPRLNLRVDNATTLTLTSLRSAVVSWHPYARSALVDPISAGAGNLRQRRDPNTGRTIVDRDPTHGLTAWSLSRFRLRPSLTEPMKILALDPAVPLREGVFSACSLVPWVNCEDRLVDSTDKRSLHHRNLVLEIGEFASASQDRSADGTPNAIASTLSDFVEAVRDPYTVAIANLPRTPAGAVEITNWCPGVTVTNNPRAWQFLPDANADISQRLPQVRLAAPYDQKLTALYRDASHRPTPAPHSWLTLDVRWDSTSSSQKPEFSLRPPQDSVQDRWQRARNGSVPLLFNGVDTINTSLAEFPGTGLNETWLATTDAQRRIHLHDYRTRTQLAEFAGDETSIGLFVGVVGTRRIVATVDVDGQLQAWIRDGAGFVARNPTMATAAAATAAFAVFEDRLIFAITYPGANALLIWSWDPAAADANGVNPRRIDQTLPAVPIASASRLQLVAAADLWVAVSHPTATSSVLRGTPASGSWQFTALDFPVDEPATEISATWFEKLSELYVATVNPARLSCRIWKRENAALISVEQQTRTVPIDKVTIAPRLAPDGALVRPELLLGLADGSGVVEFVSLDPLVPNDRAQRYASFNVETFRAQLGRIASLECRPIAEIAGHLGRGLDRRNALVAGGSGGTAVVWDVETGHCNAEFATHRLVYDNLGAVRPTGLAASPVQGVTVELLNYPLTTDTPRNNSSEYAPEGSIVSLTVAPNAPFSARAGKPGIDRTDVNFACCGLKLRLEAGLWKPESRILPEAPQSNRPALSFPVSRADFGWYTFFANEEHGDASIDHGLNTIPRVTGSLVRGYKLDSIKFKVTNGITDFGTPEEIHFQGVLLNPLLLPIDSPPGAINRATEAAINSGAIVKVRLARAQASDHYLKPASATSDGPIVWELAMPDATSGVLPGQLVRLSATVRMTNLPIDEMHTRPRLILEVSAEHSRAELLGGSEKLRQGVTLAGYEYGGKRGFGYELIRNNPDDSSPAPFALDRTVREFSGTDAVRSLSAEGDLLAVARDTAVEAFDLESGACVSRCVVIARPRDMAVGRLRAPMVVALSDVNCEFWDPETAAPFSPGHPDPSSGLTLDSLPGSITGETNFSAGAMASESVEPRLYLGEFSGRVTAWDVNVGRRISAVDQLTGPISALGVAAGAKTFVAAADAFSRRMVLLEARDDRLDVVPCDLPRPAGKIEAPIRSLSLHFSNANELSIAAISGGNLICWRVDLVGASAVVAFDTAAQSAVVGRSGTDSGVFYSEAEHVRFRANGQSSAADIGDANDSPCVVAFGESPTRRVLVAAAVGAATKVWTQDYASGSWDSWVLSPVELDVPWTTTRLAVSIIYVAGQFQVVMGAASGPGETIPLDAVCAIETWSLDSPTPVFRQRVVGSQVTAGVVLAPHAAVCSENSNEVAAVDLRTGRTRYTLTGPAGVQQVRFVNSPSVDMLVLGADRVAAIRSDRTPTYEYVHSEPLHTLEVSEGVALIAGQSGALAWQCDAPPDGSAVSLTSMDPIARAALRSLGDGRSFALLAVDANGDASRRCEPFDFDFSHAPHAWTTFAVDEALSLLPLMAYDELHVAVGHSAGVEVWTLAPHAGVPASRWAISGLASPPSSISTWSPSSGPYLIVATASQASVRPISRFLRLTNCDAKTERPKLTAHLDIAFSLRGSLAVEARIAPNDEAVLTARDGSPQALRAETFHRGVYGFLGQPLAGPWGQFPLALARLPNGSLVGGRVKERRRHLPEPGGIVVLSNVERSFTINATADLIVQDTVPLEGQAMRLVSGRVMATLPDGSRLTYHIGEQQLRDENRDGIYKATSPTGLRGIIAQMIYSGPNIEIQGPARVEIEWTDPDLTNQVRTLRVMPVNSVHRLTPVVISDVPGDASRADVAVAHADGSVECLDLASVELQPNYRAGFVRLVFAAQGMRWQKVADTELPFDICFDDGIIQPIPVQPAMIPQIVHRQVLGPRVRHQQLGGTVLRGVTDQAWNPSDFLVAATPDTATQWLAAPVINSTATAYSVWEQLLAARPGSADDPDSIDDQGRAERLLSLRTENLLFLDIFTVGSTGVLSSLQNSTAVVGSRKLIAAVGDITPPTLQLLLEDAAVTNLLVPLDAPGIAAHRLQCDGDAAVYRIVDRPARIELPMSAIAEPVSSVANAKDFRLEDSLRRARLLAWELVTQSQYRLQPFVLDPVLDNSDRVWRRFKYADALAPIEPPREVLSSSGGLLITDRTAFHRAPLSTFIPSADDVFEGSTTAECFMPRAFEFRLAEDKPGAMQHHSLRAVEQSAAGVALAPATEFAYREPMQLTPPQGADLEIVEPPVVDAGGPPPAEEYSNRWSFTWRETLGSFALRPFAANIKVIQPNVDNSTPPDELPEPDHVTVGFDDSRLLQCFVRINEELLEIDERQPQFPIYDSRQSAWDPRTLGEDDLFRPTETPAFAAGLRSLDALTSTNGFHLLAGVGDELHLWEPALALGTSNPQLIPGSVGVLAAVQRESHVLSNETDSGAGIALHRSDFASSITVSTSVTDAIAFAFERVRVDRAGSPTFVETYIALTPSAIRVWTRDETALPDAPLTELPAIPLPATADEAVQFRTLVGAEASGSETLRIAVAGGSAAWSEQIGVWSLDVESKATVSFGPYPALGLRVMELGAFGDRTVLFAAFADRVVSMLVRNPDQVSEILQFQPAIPPAVHLAFGRSSTRHIVAAVLEGGGVRVWDAEQGRILRTIDDTSAEILIELVQVSGQLRIVIGDTGGSGEISMYDPKFTPARPPETFLVSPHDDLLDARPFEIQYKVNDAADSQTVYFTPKLLLQDRLDATLPPHDVPLSDLFTRVARENEITIWQWNQRDMVEGVPWERGLSWGIAWRGELTIDGTTYELDAKLFEPLAAKMLKPTPYSSVAPKMAAVALFDSGNAGARVERMQRTLLFGDAAAAAGGSPTIVLDSLNHLLFRYQSTDRETVDVPRLPTGWEGPRHLMLLNYLVNGQVIATACAVI